MKKILGFFIIAIFCCNIAHSKIFISHRADSCGAKKNDLVVCQHPGGLFGALIRSKRLRSTFVEYATRGVGGDLWVGVGSVFESGARARGKLIHI